MKSIVLVVCFLGIQLAGSAQNVVYDANAEVRQLPAFSGIEVSGTISLYLAQGNEQGVAVSAGDSRYNSKIKTTVKDNILHLSVDGGVWNTFNWADKKLKAYVTVKDLNRLDVSGACYVKVYGKVMSEQLRMDISGVSEVQGLVDIQKLNLDLSGASEAKLSGRVKDGIIDASGASKVNSYELVGDNVKISASGASNIKVTVNGVLHADASGGSVINYKGTGIEKVVNASGGSSIKNRNQ